MRAVPALPAMRRLATLALCLVLAACGGGGGGGGSNSQQQVHVSLPASPASPSDSNVAAVQVRNGPTSNVNIPYVTVTICRSGAASPGTGCVTIPDVMVDTGSTGLRVFGSFASGLGLPAQTIGSSSAVFECANFLNSNAWGSVKRADVLIGGERASNVPVQLLNAAADASSNAKCSGAPLLTSSTLSANGILGVGVFSYDGQNYFDCTNPGTGCRAIVNPAPSLQVQNPVALLPASAANGVANNNGVVLQLPAVAAGGATSASGYLIMGVNTQSNNQLGAAHIVPTDPIGRFTTVFNGHTLGTSFIDSGSNGLYFDFPTPAALAGTCTTTSTAFYCPASTTNLSATIAPGSSNITVNFSIANADRLFQNNNNFVFNNLGGVLDSTTFDWGLPFFLGRSVYTVMEGSVPNVATGALSRPFYAFTD